MNEQLIRESFERIAVRKDEFAESFYRRLQERAPQLQRFFVGVDMQRQQSSLIATLGVLVRALERGEDLMPAFRKLGVVHAQRGIRAEQYPDFGNVLMETMAQFDPAWTVAHREAWASLLDQAVRGMMESYDPGATVYRVQVSGVRRRGE